MGIWGAGGGAAATCVAASVRMRDLELELGTMKSVVAVNTCK